MKNWKYIFVVLIGTFVAFVLILITSCKKDNQLKTYTMDATIKDTGSIAVDGCDWQVVADSTYHPLNLGDQYKVNNLKVSVTFHKSSSRFYCGMIVLNLIAQPGLPEIVIDKIQAE